MTVEPCPRRLLVAALVGSFMERDVSGAGDIGSSPVGEELIVI